MPGSLIFVAVPFVFHAVRHDFYDGQNQLLWMMAPVLLMLATMLATPAVLRRFEVARYRRGRARDTNDLESREVTREGFTAGEGEGSQFIPWTMITRVLESENYYFFYNALSDVPEYLPKRAMTESDVMNLDTLLNDQFRSRSSDLRLRARAT